MTPFTKREKQELRKFAGLAYERELAGASECLYEKFGEWKKSKITPFELSDHIHQFHDGISRDLWKTYDNRDNHLVAARAVASGIISKTEVSDGILEKLETLIKIYQEHNST